MNTSNIGNSPFFNSKERKELFISNYNMKKGGSVETDKFDGCDLVFCGDIHKRQIFNIPGGKKAYMVGSTIQQNYGETIKKHGYGIYDVINNTYDFVDLDNPKPFLSFKMKSFDDIVNGTEKLSNF